MKTEMEIKALKGCKHMTEGKTYTVGIETGKALVKRKWAVEAK